MQNIFASDRVTSLQCLRGEGGEPISLTECIGVFNHLYVMGPESYGVRRNNVNYMPTKQLKVTDFDMAYLENSTSQ